MRVMSVRMMGHEGLLLGGQHVGGLLIQDRGEDLGWTGFFLLSITTLVVWNFVPISTCVDSGESIFLGLTFSSAGC